MNTGDYIESGILESYVLGMLGPQESAEVEAMATEHPEVRKAVRELEETLLEMADANRVEPDPAWKDEILSAAIAEESKATNPEKQPVVKPLQGAAVGSEADQKNNSINWLAVAATIILLISLGINMMQYRSLERIEEKLDETELRVAELESENQVMVANYKDVQQDLRVLRDPGTATFIMKGVEGRDPNYLANIYWNSTTEKVYLDVKSLPEAPAGKQYQLWALKDGKPVDMGVFDVIADAESLLEMGAVPGADAFAVTLEQAGGVESPTLEAMYVYGEPVQS